MNIDGCQFIVDSISKFHKSLYVSGWFHVPGDALRSVAVDDPHAVKSASEVGLHHGGVLGLGQNLGFAHQSLRDTDRLDLATPITFTTQKGRRVSTTLGALSADRLSLNSTPKLSVRFHDELRRRSCKTMLDIGGRDRSQIDRSMEFPEVECTVLDIIASSNVDVVGDAHEISSLFPANSFDAVFSSSVFEHLAMPWRVVVEMNRVMKPGAIGLISTHQTIGMHDRPWDFFRFSDSTWDALLNEATGFRIIDRAMDGEQYVIPFILHDGKQEAEKAAGFEGSAVLFEKVSDPRVDWHVGFAEIISTYYPSN